MILCRRSRPRRRTTRSASTVRSGSEATNPDRFRKRQGKRRFLLPPNWLGGTEFPGPPAVPVQRAARLCLATAPGRRRIFGPRIPRRCRCGRCRSWLSCGYMVATAGGPWQATSVGRTAALRERGEHREHPSRSSVMFASSQEGELSFAKAHAASPGVPAFACAGRECAGSGRGRARPPPV